MHQRNIVSCQANLPIAVLSINFFMNEFAELFIKNTLEKSLAFKRFVLPFIYLYFCATVIA